MADAQATFAIDLEDGTSKTAESAATALKGLRAAMDADVRALADLNRAMKNLQGGSVVNIALARDLKAKIDAKKNSIAQAQASILALGGSLRATKGAGKPAIDTFQAMAQNAAQLPGPLAGVVGRLSSLKGLLAGGAIALGVAAIAAAIAVLTVAAIAGAAALLKYGLAQANARRSELLRIEGLTKMRSWFGLAAGNAKEMQQNIDAVAASSAVSRDKIGEYSTSLYKLGLRGENAKQALEAMAIKGATQGDEAANAFAGWAAGVALAGKSVKRLSDDVKARLGGLAAKQMLDLNVQSQKLGESFSALFARIDIEGVVRAFSKVTQLFSQNTRSGQALRAIVEAIFKPMIKAVEFLGPIVKRFFQGIIIAALVVGIAVLKLRKWFRETFGDTQILKGIDAQTIALKLGAAAVGVFLAGVLLLAAPLAFVAASITVVGAALYGLGRLAMAGYRLFAGIEWKKLGTGIVDGIVKGVKGGAQWVIDAVKGLGDSAWKAFRSRLGIASPSREFAKLGLALPDGVRTGIEKGTPAARNAAADMVPVPRIPSATVGRGEGNGKAGALGAHTTTVTIGDIVVHSASDKPAEIVTDIRRELQTMLEQVAIQLGAVG